MAALTTPHPGRTRPLAMAVAVVVLALVSVLTPGVAGPVPPAGAAAFPDPGAPTATPVDTLDFDLGDAAFSYRGFPAAMELRGRVYAPTTLAGPTPLVVMLHGRHVTCEIGTGPDEALLEFPCPTGSTEIPSYQGYDQLGRTLASAGYIVESISANAINANDGFLADGGADARSRLTLRHLELWRAWNASASGPLGGRFVGKVDLTRVGLMGHSRGGEGVVEAAIRNQLLGGPFGIKAVVPLAPVDFGSRLLSSVPMGVVLPYCDGDVSDLQGSQYYDDARYRLDGDLAPKQTALLYGANHNYFNTVWTSGHGGAIDDWAYTGQSDPACSKGGVGRLTAPQQRSAGVALIAGFLRRYVGDEVDLQAFVTGVAPTPASFGPARASFAFHAPDRLDINRYQGASTGRTNDLGGDARIEAASDGVICAPYVGPGCPDFDTDEVNPFAGRAEVSWVAPGARLFNAVPAASADVSAYDGLRFRIALRNDSRTNTLAGLDAEVSLRDRSGHEASVGARFYSNAFTRPPGSASQKSMLNGVHIPLSSFPSVDLTRLASVSLTFGGSRRGSLGISDLAFTREDTGGQIPSALGPAPTATPPTPCRGATWDRTRFACKSVQGLLGRDASSGEIAAAQRIAGTTAGRSAFVAVLMGGGEFRALQDLQISQRTVEVDYATDPDAGIRTPEDIEVETLWRLLPFDTEVREDPARFVDAVYRLLLRRPPSAAALAYWAPRVGATGGYLLTSYLMRSPERARLRVAELYRRFLGRSPDAAARDRWTDVLTRPDGTEATLVRYLLASGEFGAT